LVQIGAPALQSPLSTQRTQVLVAVSQTLFVGSSAHCALPVHSTHLPVLVLHTSLAEHLLVSRALHSSHVPSSWQAGVFALCCAQAVSPAALLLQRVHMCWALHIG
jgi:hypothetical protein